MQPSLPVFTDNIYKFGTSFGFVMLIAATLAFSYVSEKYDERNATHSLELELLKAKDVLSRDKTVRKSILEWTIDRNYKREYLLLLYIALFGSVGLLLLILNGKSWLKKVQPKQDELVNLQIEKMKRDIQALDRQLR